MDSDAPESPASPQVEAVVRAACDRSRISGLTHDFYRYPARFSPRFARAAIKQFTAPGDLVLDPFMGGGTTIVEARAQGRRAIGTDASSLAVFVALSKTASLTSTETEAVSAWIGRQVREVRISSPAIEPSEWVAEGYHRNFSGRESWRIRKFLEIALSDIDSLGSAEERRFARAVLLRTAQWAVDTRHSARNFASFRDQLFPNFRSMVSGLQAFESQRDSADDEAEIEGGRLMLLQRRAEELAASRAILSTAAPRLILTSPPYPGVHVLYHRWQIGGGKETPAPFWIAGVRDGAVAQHYTLAARDNLDQYFDRHQAAFSSLAALCDRRTVLVQLIAFSNPEAQLDRYLESMDRSGFQEARIEGVSFHRRYWRDVPSRRWYSEQRGVTPASRELVLFHQLR